jgi:alkanesulfonate monooxygenase SsuD/methylene tetrahydromethanopterin reductase-like flavin-dependent oxidoreductase (luciferase family)
LKDSFEILEETLQLAHQMWSGEAKPFEGKHLHRAETLNSPPALSKPHPPILIGGTGEEKTFRLIAKYGDACNIFDRDPDFIRHKYAVLRERCDEVGRPWSEIEKTVLSFMLVTPDGQAPTWMPPAPFPLRARTPAQAIEHFQSLAELGTDHAIFSMPNDFAPDAFEVWGSEIVPAVHKIVPAGR